MRELRKDPVIGRWIIVSTDRARRPEDFKQPPEADVHEKHCPFCSGNESETPPEVYAARRSDSKPNGPDWDVRVVSSIAPIFKADGELNRHGKGMYDLMNGVGAHEVVIETPQHIGGIYELSAEQIANVIRTWIYRIKELERDERFKYVLLFKNHGVIAGAGIVRHTRSQLIATPINPKRVKEELVGAKTYYEYKERCVFCDIIRQELDEDKRVVVDIDGFISIMPFASRFPFETWVMGKRHSSDFEALTESEIGDLAKLLKTTLTKMSRAVNDPPYNMILHNAPFRRKKRKAGYWRTIEDDFHWHIEIMPRLTRVAGFEWGSGFYINPMPPEDAVKYLKEAEG